MKLDARWTDDCQGKKNYDAPIVTIDSRYYPGGGESEKHGGYSSLILRHTDGNEIELTTCEFEGDTEEKVKALVEDWAQKRFDEIVEMLKSNYIVKE